MKVMVDHLYMFGSSGIYYCMYFCIVVVVYSEQQKCNLMY